MGSGLTFEIAPIELVQTLERNAATLFGVKQRGDFLPRPALAALFADEFHERFEAAAISPPAAPPFIFGYRIHTLTG